MKRRGLIRLALSVGAEPPTEFRVFTAGWNQTTKGTFLFDAESARSVMAAFERHAADIMVDLEHLSLDDQAPNFDPDARGWLRFEVREGELWAVGVTWTPDGDRRLREKCQRYISPAFMVDKKTRRITEVINIAITAMPATDNLEPLVAAAGRTDHMDPKVLEALGLPPDATPEQVLAAIAAMKEQANAAAPASMSGAGEGAPAPAPGAAGGAVKKVTTEYASAASRDVSTDLATELAQLRKRVEVREVREIIAANRRKIDTPALEKWALTQFPEALAAWVAAAPERAPIAAREKARVGDDGAGGAGGGSSTELTPEDRKLCKLMRIDPKELADHRKTLAARAAEEEV